MGNIKTSNTKRIDKIKGLFSIETDEELATYLNTTQPQISRWRKSGMPTSTKNLIDMLLLFIKRLKRKIRNLEKGPTGR